MHRNTCEKDGLTIYNTADGTGEPERHRMCGSGRNMVVTMSTNVAYITYETDAENRWEGRRGFYATFSAAGLLLIDFLLTHNLKKTGI